MPGSAPEIQTTVTIYYTFESGYKTQNWTLTFDVGDPAKPSKLDARLVYNFERLGVELGSGWRKIQFWPRLSYSAPGVLKGDVALECQIENTSVTCCFEKLVNVGSAHHEQAILRFSPYDPLGFDPFEVLGNAQWASGLPFDSSAV